MSDFPGIVALQADALIDALRLQRERRCRELCHDAERQAKALVADTRRQLRERGRQAVDEERKRRDSALLQARNRVQAEASLRRLQLHRDVLVDGWPRLGVELQRRWSSPDSRRRWCLMLLDEAAAALPHDQWIVGHPPDWSGDDEQWLHRELQSRGIPGAEFRCEPGHSAGLALRRQSAAVDGSIDGLLRQRARIEGRLLAAWNAGAGDGT